MPTGHMFHLTPLYCTGVLTQDYINTSNIWYILILHNKVNKPNSCDVNHAGPKLVQIQDLYRIQREHLESYLTIKTRGKERLPVKELLNKDLFPTTWSCLWLDTGFLLPFCPMLPFRFIFQTVCFLLEHLISVWFSYFSSFFHWVFSLNCLST